MPPSFCWSLQFPQITPSFSWSPFTMLIPSLFCWSLPHADDSSLILSITPSFCWSLYHSPTLECPWRAVLQVQVLCDYTLVTRSHRFNGSFVSRRLNLGTYTDEVGLFHPEHPQSESLFYRIAEIVTLISNCTDLGLHFSHMLKDHLSRDASISDWEIDHVGGSVVTL